MAEVGKMKTSRKRGWIVLTVFFSVVYMLWRICYTFPFRYGWLSIIFGLALLLTEIVGFFEMLVHFRELSHERMPERPEVNPEDYPHVDVFISTYNEPPQLLYKTINACLNMDYPDPSKVHIYLCDDGHREEMGKLAKKMGITHLVPDTHEFAKAGNLNYAMSVTKSPYIVTFDADMMPHHDFLTACIPYFLGEEKIGFLQTPQSFYNPDLFQYNLYSEKRFPNEQDYFYRDVQVMRNASNTVIYGGTNTILSRQALEDAGGFYTGVITEDFATGMMIQSKGYQCYAIDEVHAIGMAPEDLKSLIKQRQRWARGCIQTGRKVKLLRLKGLSVRQKISYLSSITYWYSPLKRLIYFLSPVLYAVFGIIVVECNMWEVLAFWLPMYLLNNYTLKQLSGNIRNTRLTNVYDTILFPSLLPSVILETFGISQKKFVVTKKDAEQKLEGEGFWYKTRQALPLHFFMILHLVGVIHCVRMTFVQASPLYAVILFWLGVNSYNLMMAIFFMYGRRAYRRFERFEAAVDCVISYGTRAIRTKTLDISENGISMLLDFPEWIPPEEPVTVLLQSRHCQALWEGRLANVMNHGDSWRYGFLVEKISEADRRSMLQMVYDREPSLPKEMETGLSTMDDIVINIRKRAGKEAKYFSRKLPRINLACTVLTAEAGKAFLSDFNYYYLTAAFPKGMHPPETMTIIEGEIHMLCQKEEKSFSSGTLYRIVNAEETARHPEMRAVLQRWMHTYNRETAQEEQYRKQVASVLADEAFDELEYL